MGYQSEFRHFKYFLAVADELHFRRAAEKLYISQPGLSRQIKNMEDDMKIKLFARNSRKVELTKAGEYLHKELKAYFNHLDDIIYHAKLLNDGIDGNLNIGYVGSAMQKVIPEILLKFKKSNPNVHLSLSEIDNKKQISALLKHDIDIGFVRLERVPSGLEMRAVNEDTFSLVLPESHPISESNYKGLHQLKDEHFILFDSSYSESYFEKVMQIFDDAGFTPLISHYTINASSIYRLTENNFGVSIVPTSLKLGFNMGVKFIELKNISQRTTLKIVWNTRNTNPVLQNLIKITPSKLS